MIDFSLDAMYPAATDAAPPADPWLARRLLSFGASEALALLLALGLEEPDHETPKYILDAAARLFAVKAGTRKAKSAGRAAQLGSDAERPLVAAWNEAPPQGWPAITHADAMPASCSRCSTGTSRDSPGRRMAGAVSRGRSSRSRSRPTNAATGADRRATGSGRCSRRWPSQAPTVRWSCTAGAGRAGTSACAAASCRGSSSATTR